MEAGWATSQRWIAGVWWVEALSMTRPEARFSAGVQIGRPVPGVVVGAPLRHSRQQRQDRLGAVHGLRLGLLIHAQHHRCLWRVEEQAHQVADLLEPRIRGQLGGVYQGATEVDAAAAALAAAARTVTATYAVNMEPALSGLEVIAELELAGGVGPRRRPTAPAGHAREVGARRWRTRTTRAAAASSDSTPMA
jgi:hypothetical protein